MRDILDVELDIKCGKVIPNQDVTKGGAKFDNGKPRFSLLPWKALAAIVETYNYGAKKYSDRNWERGIAYSRLFDAAMRHLTAWWEGEENDPESGLSHLAHAGFNVIALLAYQIYSPYRANPQTLELFDDRPGPYKEV